MQYLGHIYIKNNLLFIWISDLTWFSVFYLTTIVTEDSLFSRHHFPRIPTECFPLVKLLLKTLCCCCSVAVMPQLFATPWIAACQASLSFTISLNLLRLMSIEWVMPSNHLILCHLLLLLPSVFPSIRVFSNELALRIRWPKYWSFNISFSNEYSGLTSFRIDWFDLLAV